MSKMYGWFGRSCRWVGKAEVRKCLEILMTLIILSMTIFNFSGKVMADTIDASQVDPLLTAAEAEAGADMEAAAGTGMEAETGAGDEEAAGGQLSEAANRVKHLQEQLTQMTSASIDSNVSKFTDMEVHWSRQVVGKLTGLGIIAGYDGKFWPGNPVQVDQFIKMSVMAMGYKIEQGIDYWAQPYIDIALSEGIVEKGEFVDYKQPLTREQMARIAVRTVLKLEPKPDNQNEQYIRYKISDFDSIGTKYKQYVLNGYKLGLIQGSGGKYRPQDTLTRAEAAAVIIRILDATERKPTKPASEEDRFPWEINYPSDEELARMYKNPDIPERLYTRLADSDEGEVAISKAHHKFLCRGGGLASLPAEYWAEFAEGLMEVCNNIDYRNSTSEFKDNMKKYFNTTTNTSLWSYKGKSWLSPDEYIEEYTKDFVENTVIEEAKFLTDPTLVYFGGIGYFRVRGTLYFKFSEPTNSNWIWYGSTVGEWHQVDIEIDFSCTLKAEPILKKVTQLESAILLEDDIDV